MSQETLERLERLRKLNSNRHWVNHDLYRLMYKEDLYIVAYERMKSKPGNMTPGTDEETLDGFSLDLNRGIQHYYRFVDNWNQLRTIQYILKHSLAKTLARKYKLSTAKVFKRFGKGISVTVRGKDRNAFQSGVHSDIDLVRTGIKMRTRSKLGKPCCICGETAGQIAMHHVRHIRKLSHKREAAGFQGILRAINRKQIPVCTVCHRKIHRGEYDELKLSTMAYIPS